MNIKDRNLLYQLVLWIGLTLLSLTITSCSGKNLNSIAKNISKKSHLRAAEIKGGDFVLRVYYRFTKAGAPLHVYLEGDGRSWLTPARASYNPTPRDPVGLSLAAGDNSDNVLYIARPCQYVSFDKNPLCKYPYWTHKRFAPEVIKSVSAVIDRGLEMSQGREIEMIGFSGGGAVAILVSSQRKDVTGIRTVAGNLNHKLWTNQHKIDPLMGSLDPIDVAKKVSRIPQMHYVGMLDKIIDRRVADSFKSKSGPNACIIIKEIVGADHTNKWAELWDKLSKIKLPVC